MIRKISEFAGAVVQSIHSPQIVDADPTAAYQLACELHEPVFVPILSYADDRGWSLMNQLQGVLSSEGQVNYSVQYPGVVKAWHRHQFQTDFWICLNGNLKAGVYREDDGQAWQIVFGEKRNGMLIVPPTLWHGAATVGPASAGLLYYVTKVYNPQQPDEERRPSESVLGFPWSVQHR